MHSEPFYKRRFLRSLLSVPAIHQRALSKARTLGADGIILDLEDSVAEEKKPEARDNLAGFFTAGLPENRLTLLRVNALSSGLIDEDMALARRCNVPAILAPKVEHATDIAQLRALAGPEPRLWAMIETPLGVLNVNAIAAEAGKFGLDGLIIGLNDLRKESLVPAEPGRNMLIPWMMQVVLAARAYHLAVIDSVFNDFNAKEAFEAECFQGKSMGFDGKMLIHPNQIDAANQIFGPSAAEIEEARIVTALFDAPEAKGVNIINYQGRMIERLHAEQARQLLGKLQQFQEKQNPVLR